MKNFIGFIILMALMSFGCSVGAEKAQKEIADPPIENTAPTPFPENTTPSSSPEVKKQDILKDIGNTPTENEKTADAIGKIDFKNYRYPMPRGWQNNEDKEVVLENGKRPIAKEKIGVSFVKTLYFDVTGDEQDEAIVILRIGTGGSSIPQIVYLYTLENEEEAKLLWYFRTGDRADAGLKDLRSEDGLLVVELFGQDRYIFGEVETLKIPGDEVQICCPTHFTQTKYKWTGRNFQMQGKRLTFSLSDPNSPPEENKGDIILQKHRGKK